MSEELKPEHQEFINQYFLNNMNQTKAYMAVYPGSSYDAARSSASTLLTNPNIKAEIDRRLEEMAMPAKEAIARLSEQGRASVGDFLTRTGRIDWKEVIKNGHLIKSVTRSKRGDKIELYDAQSAIRDTLKLHGKFNDAGSSEDRPFIVKVVYGDRDNNTPTPTASETD